MPKKQKYWKDPPKHIIGNLRQLSGARDSFASLVEDAFAHGMTVTVSLVPSQQHTIQFKKTKPRKKKGRK